MRTSIGAALFAILAVASVGLVGCNPSGIPTVEQPTVDNPSPASGGGGPEGVLVTLSEWRIETHVATAVRGEVTFAVRNRGTIPHQLVVARTDLPLTELPMFGTIVDVRDVDVVGQLDPFDPGGAQPLTVNVTRGRYVLFCNLPGHYAAGMRLEFPIN